MVHVNMGQRFETVTLCYYKLKKYLHYSANLGYYNEGTNRFISD